MKIEPRGYCDDCHRHPIPVVEYGGCGTGWQISVCAACLVKALRLFPTEDLLRAKAMMDEATASAELAGGENHD